MKLWKLFNIRVALLVLWAAALIAVVVILGPDRVLGSYKGLTPQGIKDSIDAFGVLYVVTFLVANMLRPLLFLPVSPFTIASGFMFGMWWGLLWAMVGSTASAVLIFFLSRYMLHGFVTKSLKGRYPSIDKLLEGRGWSFMLFLRIIPLLPFDLVSCIAGVSDLGLGDFLIGTIIGDLPGTVVLVMLGSSLDDPGSGFFYLSIVLAVAVFAGTEMFRRWMNKRRKEQLQ